MGGKPRPRLEIGWREWVELPELCDEPIKAKIDTGARTSSLHAENVRIVRRGGERYARFTVIDKGWGRGHEAIAPLVDRRAVRSSNGSVQNRYVIATKVSVGHRTATVELTLASRDEMGFRMLLGRQAIRKLRASVHPIASFLASSE